MAHTDGNNNGKEDIKNPDASLLSLKGCKEWLGQQHLDYEVELNRMRKAEQDKLEGRGELNTEQLCESVLQLQEELLDVSTAHSTKQYVLEKLLTSYVKMKKLFPTTEPKTDESVSKIDEFADQIDEEQKLCKDILKYQQAFEEEQVTLRDVERQGLEASGMSEKLRARLKQLQTKQQANKSKKEIKGEASLRKQIVERQDMIEVARNICQALVFGSDVEWAEDEELRKMVLSFGKPLNLLDA